ncbi:hypothetical protein [Sulfitobacter sp. S190]|uniref:hypothetical protein n=1 Tax=Sulfitobacter sp. S190 TaxID=2867022 RepID=UPI0021A75916|nr:hypothetical protein [Sulfitobacter sp. S190]UWR24478.1 hypothetical protein K3756_18670 [Sulfitobacter sp. S190]UWR24495.1 hypothetical protein K3756_18475 [Sulfitobacter sp. S190]
MARKRKLDAGPIDGVQAPETKSMPGMGGMWGGTALNMLRQRLDDTRSTLTDGIMNGTVAVRLDPDQVLDPMGSDRQSGWQDDPEFLSLVDNIKRRGQTQAIRVRPADANWLPDGETPTEVSGQFIIQSGRRRLAACAQLDRPVIAVLSTVEGDAALADLEERFHENTMRKNLNGFEELLSIGLIAESLGFLSQQEIATRLSVSQNDVSLGRACVELHDRIVADIDIANTPKRAYREIIPQLRGKAAPPKLTKSGKVKPAVSEAQQGQVKVAVKRASNGNLQLKLSADHDVDPDWLARAVARMVNAQKDNV